MANALDFAAANRRYVSLYWKSNRGISPEKNNTGGSYKLAGEKLMRDNGIRT